MKKLTKYVLLLFMSYGFVVGSSSNPYYVWFDNKNAEIVCDGVVLHTISSLGGYTLMEDNKVLQFDRSKIDSDGFLD